MNDPASIPISLRAPLPEEHPEVIRLLALLNPETPTAVLEQRLADLLREHPNYELIAAYLPDGRMAGITGLWTGTKMWCGRYLEIDNLVVDPDCRSAGVGTAIIEYAESLARLRHCNLLILDSYTGNRASHRLYHRLGLEVWGFHFVKTLGDWSGADSATK